MREVLPLKRIALIATVLCLVLALMGCNRKFAQAGDKKQAYKRKYKCKMCHVPLRANPSVGGLWWTFGAEHV